MVSERLYFLTWCITSILSIFSIALIASLPFSLSSTKKDFSDINTKKAIVFDLGNVLLKTNHWKAIKIIGLKDVISYCIAHKTSLHIVQENLYSILDPLSPSHSTIICDPYGKVMPSLFCQVLKGHITESKALPLAVNAVDNYYAKQHAQAQQKRLCHALTTFMFDPQALIKTQSINKEALALIKECQKAGHEVFICSNMGKETFDALQKTFPELFSLIPASNILISAHVNAAKPETSMYKALLQRINNKGIQPSTTTCFFIDDQKENIQAAENNGFKGILKSRKHHFGLIRKQLKSFGLFTQPKHLLA